MIFERGIGMGKLFSVIKKGYYGNVVTVMFREKELLRFYRSQTGARVFLFGKKFLKRSLPEKYLLKNACNNASMQASCFDDIVRQSKKTVVFVIDSMESIGGVEMRLYHEACYLKSIGYEPIIVAKYNLNDKLAIFCWIIRHLILLIGLIILCEKRSLCLWSFILKDGNISMMSILQI